MLITKKKHQRETTLLNQSKTLFISRMNIQQYLTNLYSVSNKSPVILWQTYGQDWLSSNPPPLKKFFTYSNELEKSAENSHP